MAIITATISPAFSTGLGTKTITWPPYYTQKVKVLRAHQKNAKISITGNIGVTGITRITSITNIPINHDCHHYYEYDCYSCFCSMIVPSSFHSIEDILVHYNVEG